MEGREEDVRVGANKFSERQPIGTAAQDRDYQEPPPAPLFEPAELSSWSFYRAGIAEFMATFLFLYISILTVMGVVKSNTKCSTVGIQGIAWAFGGMIFILVYCTAGISGEHNTSSSACFLPRFRSQQQLSYAGFVSGGHINPAVTFGLLLARKLSLTRALFYMVMQCLGAICGAGVVKGFKKGLYDNNGGGANVVAPGYTKGDGLGAEIVGTFILVYTVFSATDAKRSARDSHVPPVRVFYRSSSLVRRQVGPLQPSILGPLSLDFFFSRPVFRSLVSVEGLPLLSLRLLDPATFSKSRSWRFLRLTFSRRVSFKMQDRALSLPFTKNFNFEFSFLAWM
ncbi:hypothetical protein BHE74_00049306 [Ensete ventricosum]|uniref:Uncharacterized protein n=1 Tax=Ensete ventricosum TaxID=4639 RepID=A0A426YRY0_ENSVE|nr:hypothetical protein B296_00048208 [Ensete ventricosum]RWW21600.1 hypothetical protein GW17_00014243 [Ensete ventricosum]RWW44901.1 hypothetical protein BHE74_00049306 [Ensete ventricosum]RZR92950.1 hypothetical protein BHM03_00021326 [Ensete ventricosum]